MSQKTVTNREKILNLLKDRKPHFSSEFRDELGLLEYRKRIMELREEGFIIESLKIQGRPAYRLMAHMDERVHENEGQKEWGFEK